MPAVELGFRKRVVIEPASKEDFSSNGSPNFQLSIGCSGVYFDKARTTTHFLIRGKGPGRLIEKHDDNEFSRSRSPGAVFAARSNDHGEHVEFYDLSGNVDRMQAQPVLHTSDSVRRGAYGVANPRITPLRTQNDKTVFLVTADAVNRDERHESLQDIGRATSIPIKGNYTELYLVGDWNRPETFQSLGFLGPENEYFKNTIIHPELITIDGEQHILLYCRKLPGIQYYTLPYGDLPRLLQDDQFRESYWQENFTQEAIKKHTIMEPIFSWEGFNDINNPEGHLAGGPPPIEVTCNDPLSGEDKQAWLFIYNCVPFFNENKEPGGRYIGAALLDKNEPWKVIARSPEPIIIPEHPMEVNEGRAKNVVFSTGAYIDADTLRIFYTQGDTNLAVFEGPLNNMINYLQQYNQFGELLSQRRSPVTYVHLSV